MNIIAGYTVIREISSGVYGKVYELEKNGERYAGKYFRNWDTLQRSLNEIDLLTHIVHPNIISGKRVVLEGNTLLLVMELADTTLNDLLSSQLDSKFLLILMHQVGSGLDFLYNEMSMTHCDLKPNNILIKADKAFVADLGLSSRIVDMEPIEELPVCHNEFFRSPELLLVAIQEQGSSDTRLDSLDGSYMGMIVSEVWSYGIICLCIIYNIGSDDLFLCNKRQI